MPSRCVLDDGSLLQGAPAPAYFSRQSPVRLGTRLGPSWGRFSRQLVCRACVASAQPSSWVLWGLSPCWRVWQRVSPSPPALLECPPPPSLLLSLSGEGMSPPGLYGAKGSWRQSPAFLCPSCLLPIPSESFSGERDGVSDPEWGRGVLCLSSYYSRGTHPISLACGVGYPDESRETPLDPGMERAFLYFLLLASQGLGKARPASPSPSSAG